MAKAQDICLWNLNSNVIIYGSKKDFSVAYKFIADLSFLPLFASPLLFLFSEEWCEQQ